MATVSKRSHGTRKRQDPPGGGRRRYSHHAATSSQCALRPTCSKRCSIAGLAAKNAASPAMLHRFEHVGLSAHWELVAAWWLYLRRPPPGGSWRFLVPWLLLLTVAILTYAYLGLMVGVVCAAAYVRAVLIDRVITWWTAAWHAVVGLATVLGVFWFFGYFVLNSHGAVSYTHLTLPTI